MSQSEGLCACGCHLPTPLVRYTDKRRGLVKGQPCRYIRGHAHRIWEDWREEDRGYETPCWISTRQPDSWGYVVKRFGEYACRAHRLYHEIYKGPIPAGHQVDHLCRVKVCLNPDHLEAVPGAENNRRAHRKLTPQNVTDIRASTQSARKTAERLGLPIALVYSARLGRTFA